MLLKSADLSEDVIMTFLVRTFALMVLTLACFLPAHAQWSAEWTNTGVAYDALSGWLSFQQSGSTWQQRFYTLDSMAFRVSDGVFSQTPQYTYTFSAAERAAGELIYSLGLDLTGDGITEFYVVAANGASTNYRYSTKVFNIVTGATVFERNLTNFAYTDVSVWDVNGDGTLDGMFTRYDYPNYATQTYEVYSTGVAAAAATARGVVPQQLNLKQNYPNPFNPSTRIDYELHGQGTVRLEILNVLGQQVRTLVNGPQSAGSHSSVWDGTDGKGARQSSGTYYYQILLNGQPQQTRQMILLK
jgi:hypothetical protein